MNIRLVYSTVFSDNTKEVRSRPTRGARTDHDELADRGFYSPIQ